MHRRPGHVYDAVSNSVDQAACLIETLGNKPLTIALSLHYFGVGLAIQGGPLYVP